MTSVSHSQLRRVFQLKYSNFHNPARFIAEKQRSAITENIYFCTIIDIQRTVKPRRLIIV